MACNSSICFSSTSPSAGSNSEQLPRHSVLSPNSSSTFVCVTQGTDKSFQYADSQRLLVACVGIHSERKLSVVLQLNVDTVCVMYKNI
jgi:hypothetical protein